MPSANKFLGDVITEMSDDRIAPEGHEPTAAGSTADAEAQAATATEVGPEIGGETGHTTTQTAVVEQNPLSETATNVESIPVAAPPAPAVPEMPAPAHTPAAPKAGLDDSAEFEAALDAFEGAQTGTAYDNTYRRLRRGEMIVARVIQVDTDKVFVDLGTKSEGVVPFDELSSTPFEKPSDLVKVGDEINVIVVHPEGREGNPIVSRKRAEFEAAWDHILVEFDKKETVTAVVTERVKGGLVVDMGVRGFVPATHVGNGQIRNLDKFVGQSLKFKIIEVDRERKKVVLSNRLAEEETREEKKKLVFETVKPGDIMEGHVRRLVDYGAFIDLGGVDGLLHVSEMSWSRVDHPREVLREGDEVKVMVLRLDPASGRISLGRRQVLPDPWTTIRDNYNSGQRLTVPISRIVQSGAFVKLPEGAEAFIPISEMAHRRIQKPNEAVEVGQEVEVQVIDLRPDERRMVLSMRALLPYEERQPSQRDEVRHRSERSRGHGGGGGGGGGGREQRGGGNVPTPTGGGMTIGERLGALKGLQGTFGEEEAPAAEAPVADAPVAKAPVVEAPAPEAAVETPVVDAPVVEATPAPEAEAPAPEVAEAPAEEAAEEKTEA